MFDLIPIEPFEVSAPIIHEQVIQNEDSSWAINLNDVAAYHIATMSCDELDSDWKLNEFFGTIAVINLPAATERLKKLECELNKIGLFSFEKFQAVNGRTEVDPAIWKKFIRKRSRENILIRTKKERNQLIPVYQGEAGCYLSHYRLIKKVKKAFEESLKDFQEALAANDRELISRARKAVQKNSSLLILEDDACFGFVAPDSATVISKGVGQHLREAIQELPSDWDMLYFVIGVKEPTEEISPNLRKIKSSWSTVAYAVNHTMYADLIEHLQKIEDPSIKKVQCIDTEIGNIHQFYNVYAIYPSIAYQHVGKSEITGYVYNKLWQGQPIK